MTIPLPRPFRLVAGILLFAAAAFLHLANERAGTNERLRQDAASRHLARQHHIEQHQAALRRKQAPLIADYRRQALHLHLAAEEGTPEQHAATLDRLLRLANSGPGRALRQLRLQFEDENPESAPRLTSIAATTPIPAFLPPATVDRDPKAKSTARWQRLRLDAVVSSPQMLSRLLGTLFYGSAARPERCRLDEAGEGNPGTGHGIALSCDLLWPTWTAP